MSKTKYKVWADIKIEQITNNGESDEDYEDIDGELIEVTSTDDQAEAERVLKVLSDAADAAAGYGNEAPDPMEQLARELLKLVDAMMPGVAHIVLDVGWLNDTLIQARKLLPKTTGEEDGTNI